MLVVCSSCSAKFNVPDAKVAGKRARMKCKKCGTSIPIDGTSLTNQPGGTPPSRPALSQPSPPPSHSARPRRTTTGSGLLSTQWRVSEPSGKSHELTLSQLALRYSQGGFEPGTLVCQPGKDEWLPPYDFPEVMEKASPPGEALARPPQQTFNEVTVTLGAEESARLTRQAQPSEPSVPPKRRTFFDEGDVDTAMGAFDNIVSQSPSARSTGAIPAPRRAPPAPSAPPVPGGQPAARKSVKPPAPSWRSPDATPSLSTSRPPPPPSAPPSRSAPPGPSARSLSSRPPPLAPSPPSPAIRSVSSRPPPAQRSASSPPPPPPPSASAPPLPPSASAPPLPPSASAPPAPIAPNAIAQGSSTAPPNDFPDPSDFSADYAAAPSEPTFAPISERHRKKRRSPFSTLVFVLILLAGACGAVYFFRPALFQRGVDTIKGVVGLKSEASRAPVAEGPPFDEPTAGAVLGQAAQLAGKCREPDGPLGKGRAQVLYQPDGKAASVAVSKPFHETTVGKCLINLFKDTTVPPFGGEPVIVSKTFEVR